MKNKKAIIIVIVLVVVAIAAYFLLKKKPTQTATQTVPNSNGTNIPVNDWINNFPWKGNNDSPNTSGIKYPDNADLAGFNQDDTLNYSGHTFSANVAGGNWTLIS